MEFSEHTPPEQPETPNRTRYTFSYEFLDPEIIDYINMFDTRVVHLGIEEVWGLRAHASIRDENNRDVAVVLVSGSRFVPLDRAVAFEVSALAVFDWLSERHLGSDMLMYAGMKVTGDNGPEEWSSMELEAQEFWRMMNGFRQDFTPEDIIHGF